MNPDKFLTDHTFRKKLARQVIMFGSSDDRRMLATMYSGAKMMSQEPVYENDEMVVMALDHETVEAAMRRAEHWTNRFNRLHKQYIKARMH